MRRSREIELAASTVMANRHPPRLRLPRVILSGMENLHERNIDSQRPCRSRTFPPGHHVVERRVTATKTKLWQSLFDLQATVRDYLSCSA